MWLCAPPIAGRRLARLSLCTLLFLSCVERNLSVSDPISDLAFVRCAECVLYEYCYILHSRTVRFRMRATRLTQRRGTAGTP